MELGEKIRYTREYRDVTKEELAEYLGISPKTLANYESDLKPMKGAAIKAVAKYLNIPIGFYFDVKSRTIEEFCKDRELDEFIAIREKCNGFFEVIDLAAAKDVTMEEFKAFLEMREKLAESLKRNKDS